MTQQALHAQMGGETAGPQELIRAGYRRWRRVGWASPHPATVQQCWRLNLVRSSVAGLTQGYFQVIYPVGVPKPGVGDFG